VHAVKHNTSKKLTEKYQYALPEILRYITRKLNCSAVFEGFNLIFILRLNSMEGVITESVLCPLRDMSLLGALMLEIPSSPTACSPGGRLYKWV
jgi:hypothetical protein